MKNYYEILEVNKKASKEVIDKAYKVLIKKYHPDLYSGEKQQYAERKTKEINEAYRILSNEFLREQYDNEIEKQDENKQRQQTNEKRQFQGRQKDEVKTASNISYKSNKPDKVKTKNVGTLDSIIELTKNLIDLIRNREKREEMKEVTRKDITALVLTIIVVIIIGIALWFIPFTNGWMRELLFENPLFSWIGGLFS